jgi:hypothetical protein
MRKFIASASVAVFAMCANAQAPEVKEPWPEGVDATFTFLAKKIETRSLANCSAEHDDPALAAKRLEWLEIKSLRAAGDRSPLSLMAAMTTANAGSFSVCPDKRLVGSGYAMAIYPGRARIIAINPEFASRIEPMAAAGYDEVRAIFGRYGDGKLTDDDLEKPFGVLADSAKPATGVLPVKAPHSKPEYQ